MNKNLHVLLADDDPDDRELFAAALKEVDPSTELITVEDGEELFRELGVMEPPDVIFLDLNMPRKNGRECMIELHKDKKYKDVAVIVYSTSMSPQEIEDAWALGAACLVRKPDSYNELKYILQQVLSINLSDLAALRKSRPTFNL